MYAVDEFDKLEDMVVDRTFEQLVSGRQLFRIKKKDRRTVWHSVISVVEDAADVIARAWYGASHGIVRPLRESNPDLVRGVRRVATVMATKHVLELYATSCSGETASGNANRIPIVIAPRASAKPNTTLNPPLGIRNGFSIS